MARRGGRKPAPGLDERIEQLLAAKVPPTEVVDTILINFDVQERAVWSAIARVREKWKQAEATTVEERRAVFRAELSEAWRRALGEGDYRAIASMARTVADVEGIKAPKRVEMSGVLGLRPVAAMTPREREIEIAKLTAERSKAQGKPLPAPLAPTLELEPGDVDDEPIGGLELPVDVQPDEAPDPHLKPKAPAKARAKRKPAKRKRQLN